MKMKLVLIIVLSVFFVGVGVIAAIISDKLDMVYIVYYIGLIVFINFLYWLVPCLEYLYVVLRGKKAAAELLGVSYIHRGMEMRFEYKDENGRKSIAKVFYPFVFSKNENRKLKKEYKICYMPKKDKFYLMNKNGIIALSNFIVFGLSFMVMWIILVLSI